MRYRLLIICVFLFVGCVQDPNVEPYAQVDAERMTLSIESFSDRVVGATRSSGETTTIDRGYIFFYDNVTEDYITHKSIDELVNFDQDGATVSFDMPEGCNIKNMIVGVFNHDESADLPADFGAVSGDNIAEYFPLSADYLSQIQAEMCGETPCALGMPMFVDGFTDTDRAVREIYRSVARMELFVKDDLTIEHDSHTHPIGAENLEFAVINHATVGSVCIGEVPPAASIHASFDVSDFDISFPYQLTEYESSAGDTNNKVYLYPFPYATESINGDKLDATTFDEDRFAIILKHGDKNIYEDHVETRYYKLNLLDKATSTYFDVKPNHSYRVVIKAINSRGYDSVEEAYRMPPSNIEYEIYDDKGGLTSSNGQYAISMDEILSFDEILVYGEDETTLEFNNIRYVLPDGGQMSDADFITNEVTFKTISDDGGLIIDTQSNFDFDANNKSKLTPDGKNISVTLKGEGECTIALRIKLGNLEIGRDNIKIKKIAKNGDGDGAFDAHPNHFEIKNQIFADGSWHSNDIDFGARASSEDYGETATGTVIYMGENATPTGYRTMDGYVSGEHSKDSYPVFSPKTRKGYYSYVDAQGETRKVMIQVEQLAPFYLGHFGSTAYDDPTYHYYGLICEKIEEVPYVDYNNVPQENGGVMVWSETSETFYQGVIWGDYQGLGDRYRNLVDGLKITKSIVENPSVTGRPTAADYCYMKNDINGNGKIDANEPINWYLPSQNQMLGMWININVFDEDDGRYGLYNMGSEAYYWTSSEVDDVYDLTNKNLPPVDFSGFVNSFNMLEGMAEYFPKASWKQCHVRCVRGLH